MADVGVCNPSGCFGKCPTSTRCSRKPRKRCHPCPPGCMVQRVVCGCGCRCPAPEKCPTGVRVKDYLNVISDESIFFKTFYKLLRSSPRLPNKLSQLPKGPDGKPIMKGKKGKGKGGKDGADGGKSGGGGLFDDDGGFDDGMDGDDGGDDGTGGGSGGRRRPKPSKEARLKNKLNSLFDEALRTGLLFDRKGKKDKKRTPEYYRDVLGIVVSCPQTCEPVCCDE